MFVQWFYIMGHNTAVSTITAHDVYYAVYQIIIKQTIHIAVFRKRSVYKWVAFLKVERKVEHLQANNAI